MQGHATSGEKSETLIETLLALGFIEDFGGLPADRNGLAASLLQYKGAAALDITTLATIASDKKVRAALVLKQPGVVACLDIFAKVLGALDSDVSVEMLCQDGTYIDAVPSTVAIVEGHARTLLMAERLALNLVQRLCGVATLTRQYAQKAAGKNIKILDTRKTTPGLRVLEKRAVRAGGGTNHRMGLYDAVMIKDNHIAAAGSITAALRQVQLYLRARPEIRLSRPVQVEIADMGQLREAMDLEVQSVLLDNMSPDQVRQAISLISSYKHYCTVEVSGGVNLANIDGYLIEGVDAISIGALTHSASNLDLSLEF